MQKRIVLVGFLLFSLLFICCNEEPVTVNYDQVFMDKGKHPETEQGNNLSFPAILADGWTLTPVASSFLIPYTGPYVGLSSEELAYIGANGPWYAQKVEGNVWQAEYASVSSVDVLFVDWGDAIESVDPKLGRPYRLELSLITQPTSSMTAYTMGLLSYPSSKQETQGTNNTTYESGYASIVTSQGRLLVQRYENVEALTWNTALFLWEGEGVYSPETGFGFAPELNVGGKYIFGASVGGWVPSIEGNYRITFYVTSSSGINIGPAYVADLPFPTTPKVAENNQPFVDAANNISYVDVQCKSGGGGH